jgi:polar amino acid transport system permease protein
MNDILNILHDDGILLLIGAYPNGPIGGLALTIILSICALLLAFPLGVLIALGRISPFAWLQKPATVVVYVVRGVPLIMFIFWVYFLVPLIIGKTVTGFTTMLVTLVIYQAAYLAEIVRAGIEGLPRGQMEAARAVGLSYWQTMRQVILPQALYNMVPALISQFVSVIKETSLGYVISVNEITFAANQINGTLLTKPFQVYAILAVTYFILCSSISQYARHVERNITRKRMGGTVKEAKSGPVGVAAQVAK